MWFQSTRYAAEKQRDLLLITSDEKEDWCWRQQAAFLGPRPELALEYHQLSGRRFYLMRPSALLLRAAVLQVEVDEQSSADAGRAAEDEAEASVTAWTVEGFTALLERLEREAPVQAAALRIAAEHPNGRVSREQVYDLGGYSDDRMLRGFTTPYRRLTKALQADGLVPEGVPPVLVARYPDGVKASYFSVPAEVTAFWGEVNPDS